MQASIAINEREDQSRERGPTWMTMKMRRKRIFAVKKLPTKKSQLPQTEFMAQNIINRYPSMLLIVGKSGSGKSTVCNYICTAPQFYGGNFFHKVYLFSPTANNDDLVEHLKLTKDHIITNPTDDNSMNCLMIKMS